MKKSCSKVEFLKFLAVALLWLTLAPRAVHAQIIPSNRTVNWNLAGVPGGIPYRTNIFVNVLTTSNPSYKCAGDGVTDDSGQIANAISACPANQVVYLPAAKYNMAHGFYSASKSYFTLRGDGPGKTILIDNATGGSLYAFGQVVGRGNGADNYLYPSNTFSLSGGYTKGSSNITTTVANNGGVVLAVGNLIQISESNDWFVTSVGQNGAQGFSSISSDGQHCLNQMAVITAISNGTNLTIWPPLCWTYSNSLSPVLYLQDFANYYVPAVPRQDGFENLTITNALGSASEKHVFDMYCPVQCWWTNVECVNEKNYCLGFLDDALQCQIDHCWIHATSTNYIYYQDYDLETEFSSYCLIQNCIFDGFFEGVQIDSGGCGNVVAYNLFTNFFNAMATGGDQGRVAPGLSISHGAYPMMNLVEGNVGMGVQADFYWGSSGFDTILRNKFTSTDRQWTSYALSDIVALKLDSSNLWDNVIGNILGSPAVSYSNYAMSGQQGYTYSVIGRFGYPGIDSDSYTGVNSGTQSLDATVQPLAIMAGNFDYYHNAITNPTNNIPNSLCYSAKPAWFGNCPWPAYDPSSPSTASVTNIPAGYRFMYGVDPTGAVAAPLIPPSNLQVY